MIAHQSVIFTKQGQGDDTPKCPNYLNRQESLAKATAKMQFASLLAAPHILPLHTQLV